MQNFKFSINTDLMSISDINIQVIDAKFVNIFIVFIIYNNFSNFSNLLYFQSEKKVKTNLQI